ncbi:variable surface protein [Plasmodium gonderi]|uniref:Variable surface protein n=1 Tax=Plasmodium gonderi TaxID=77519 RepID=A0A1Y1JF36_PLAGO|nr:variable surface protein [Plasmodium gonderi]GAW79053.1 variable surface protein [Plasmodium gonderi]
MAENSSPLALLKTKKNKKKNLNVIFITPLGVVPRQTSEPHKTQEIWVNFLKWFYDKKESYNSFFGINWDSKEFLGNFKTALESSYDSNKNIESFLSDKRELEKLLKLHYFGENVGDIKTILDNQNHGSYRNACEFVNECLHLFRELKQNYCKSEIVHYKSNNAVCSILGGFEDTYEYKLYTPLKSHNKMSSLLQYPESAQVRCDISDSLYYTPFWSLYKTNSEEFSVLGNFVVSGFVMFAVYLILLILYKFTPIGLHFSPGGQRKARRIWRKVEMDQFRDSGSSLYSDDSESVYSDNYDESSSTFVYGNNRYY